MGNILVSFSYFYILLRARVYGAFSPTIEIYHVILTRTRVAWVLLVPLYNSRSDSSIVAGCGCLRCFLATESLSVHPMKVRPSLSVLADGISFHCRSFKSRNVLDIPCKDFHWTDWSEFHFHFRNVLSTWHLNAISYPRARAVVVPLRWLPGRFATVWKNGRTEYRNSGNKLRNIFFRNMSILA